MNSILRHSLPLVALVAFAGLVLLAELSPPLQGLPQSTQGKIAGDPNADLVRPRTETYRQSKMGTPASFADAGVDAVRMTLRNTLIQDYPSNQALVAAVQTTLDDAFANVATSTVPALYTWVFNPQTNRWEKVCTDVTLFQIDTGDPTDPVVVKVTTYVIVPT